MAFTPKNPTLPDVSRATFDPGQAIDNPYSPFIVGDLRSYVATEAGSDELEERNNVFVTGETRTIEGVEATVVRDTVYDDEGRRLEDTLDWYAQDTDGNVWYLGEIAYEFEYDEETDDFLGAGTEGSWEWGVDGALPGLARPARSVVGDSYYQEFAPGEAEDAAQVVATDAEVSIDFGDFSKIIQTFDFSTLELTAREFKYAAPGLGVILEEGLDEEDEVEEVNALVGVRSVVAADGEADDVPLSRLHEGRRLAPDELEREDLEDRHATSKEVTVTFLGGVDDLDNAVGVYQYDRASGEIGEGRILFGSSEQTENGAHMTVDVAAGHGLGVFLVSNAGESGIDLGEFEEGGLYFRNIAADAPAALSDRLEPLATDAEGNLLPLTVLHALDAAEDGINLLNAGGAVQATELELRGRDLDGALLGFEERMATDPEADGDYNDVVLAISDEALSRATLHQVLTVFGSEIHATGTPEGEHMLGGDFDDMLFARGGDDMLRGRRGDDNLHGNRGPDTIVGGLGDDLISGGRGHDTARFHGSSEGYEIDANGNGRVVVADTNPADGDFGTDTLFRVEALCFDDDLVFV